MNTLKKNSIGESWLLLLMRLAAANWMFETNASLFELSERGEAGRKGDREGRQAGKETEREGE